MPPGPKSEARLGGRFSPHPLPRERTQRRGPNGTAPQAASSRRTGFAKASSPHLTNDSSPRNHSTPTSAAERHGSRGRRACPNHHPGRDRRCACIRLLRRFSSAPPPCHKYTNDNGCGDHCPNKGHACAFRAHSGQNRDRARKQRRSQRCSNLPRPNRTINRPMTRPQPIHDAAHWHAEQNEQVTKRVWVGGDWDCNNKRECRSRTR